MKEIYSKNKFNKIKKIVYTNNHNTISDNLINSIINRYIPSLLLILVWFVPRHTTPGGYLINFIFLRWFTSYTIPLFFFIFIIYVLVNNIKLNLANFAYVLLILFIYITLSSLITKASIITTLFTLMIYLRYPLLFIILINININEDSLKLFLFVFTIIMLIQIYETFYRYYVGYIHNFETVFYYCPDYERLRGVQKRGHWTYLTRNYLIIYDYLIYSTALLFSKSIILEMKIRYIIGFFLFFIVAIISSIKPFIWSAPLIVAFIMYSSINKQKNKKNTNIVFFGAILIIFIFIIYNIWYKKMIIKHAEKNKFESTIITDLESKNLGVLTSLNSILSNKETNLLNIIFGWGPGSSFIGKSKYSEEGIISKFNINHKNQIIDTFLDLGFLGIILYILILLYIFKIIKKHYKLEFNPNFLVLNRALIGIWLFYTFIGPFYDQYWRHDEAAYIFFFFSALIYVRYTYLKKALLIFYMYSYVYSRYRLIK